MEASPIRILIVDDEFSVLLSLGTYFENRGFDVLAVEDAEKALEKLQKETVDVAIVDMRLPGMDGETLILKAHEIQPSLKFLIYTGSPKYSMSPALGNIGITEEYFFRKPVPDLKFLAQAIDRILKREQ